MFDGEFGGPGCRASLWILQDGENRVLPLPLSQTHPLHLSSFCTCLCNCAVNQRTCEKVLFLISRPFFTQFKTRPVGSWHSVGGSRQLKEKWNIFFALGIQCTPSADAMVSVCGCSQLTLFKGWLNNSSGWIVLY